MMQHLYRWVGWGLGLGLSLIGSSAQALPGQTVEEVTAWIQAHPTLQPAPGETLLVRKSDTPARRFTFQAAITPPGRATQGSWGIIRSERVTLFDIINNVSRDRLEETLRVIYGPDIYQDYAQATVVYAYPNAVAISQSQNLNAPLLAGLQGELRQGNQFAYWVEIAQNAQGITHTGQVTIFLNTDVPRLQAELQRR